MMDPRAFEYQVLRDRLKEFLRFTALPPAAFGRLKGILEESEYRLFENSEGKYGTPEGEDVLPNARQ